MKRFPISLAMAAFLAPMLVCCQEETVPSPGEKDLPKIVMIGEHRYRFGEIVFDGRTREIRLPAAVNLRDGGPMEYLLVHEDGKTHESLLVTRVQPLHLQIVLKLLRYRSGEGDLFDGFLPKEEQRQRATAEIEAGAGRGDAVEIRLEWKPPDEEETRRSPAAPWILDAETGEGMTEEPWILTGSMMSGGSYMADVEGSIVAVYLDPYAMFNMTRPGATIDVRWGANTPAIPEIGQPVTVILRPARKASQ